MFGNALIGTHQLEDGAMPINTVVLLPQPRGMALAVKGPSQSPQSIVVKVVVAQTLLGRSGQVG